MIDELRGTFMNHSSIILGFQILGSFMEYYSPFWGPKAISMIVEPQVVLICCSSSLAVWADSSPFLGLYSVLGSRSDFHD